VLVILSAILAEIKVSNTAMKVTFNEPIINVKADKFLA
jgi:hypothetical protein